MKTIYLLLIFILLPPLFSQSKTFVREYTYNAGEADSKITSRAIALEQVKRILLEEIGIYLHSEMTTTKEEKNDVYNELTKQQIQSITAGITETKIIEEKWTGEKYYIKASISVDPDEVNKNIARIGADQSKLKELIDVKRKADGALAEIDRLRKELLSTKSENERLSKQKEYNKASNTLSASDWFQKGYNAKELNDLDDAILYYQKTIDLNPEFFEAYNNLGTIYDNKGNFDKAIQLYEKAIKINQNIFEIYANIGIAYDNKGDLAKAIQYYEKTIKLNPKDYKTHINLGLAYENNRNQDKAIQLLERAINLDPNNYIAYLNLGSIYAEKGNFDKAIEFCEKAVELNPQSSEALCNLGSLYSDNGNFKKAIELFEKAIKLNPNDPDYYKNLGFIYLENGNIDMAIRYYEKVIELKKNDPIAFVNLGSAYLKKNNFEKAIQLYQKAAQLNNKDAQKWLKDNGYSW